MLLVKIQRQQLYTTQTSRSNKGNSSPKSLTQELMGAMLLAD
jgi:hypothetical protein